MLQEPKNPRTQEPKNPRTQEPKKNYLVLSLITIVFTIASGEIFARYYLGLGTPPLSVTHPTIEYMLKPNQDVYRFGNHIIYRQPIWDEDNAFYSKEKWR